MDDFKHTSIDFNAIQTCDNELIASEIEELFRNELKVPHVTVSHRLDSQIEQQNGVTTFCGRIGFRKLTEGMNQFLKMFCRREQLQMLLRFEDTLFTLVLSDNSFTVSHQIKLRCFCLGTMARLTSFIVHFSTQRAPFRPRANDSRKRLPNASAKEYMVSVSRDDLLARFNHSKNEIHIHFRIIWEPCEKKSTVKYIYQRLKLVLSYNSVNHLILSHKDLSLSTFISISHPPFLYVLKKDFSEPIVYKKDYEEEKEKETTNYGIEFEKDRWIRVTESAVFTKDILGKCNTVKLELFVHENLNEVPPHELGEYPCPFEVINSMLKFKKCPTYFGCIREVSKATPQSIAIKMELDDSFKIVYALSCLQSVSYQFANDLLLQSMRNKMDLELKEELQSLSMNVEVFERSLFDLFQVIKSGAFVQCLMFLRRAVQRNAQEMLDSSITRNIFQIRRAVLTPTRTLLLPPLPVMESRFLLRSNPDYVLRLYLRDDDLQRLTFSLRIMDEKDKQRFTRECVRKPLVLGIRIGNRCYEVVGSSPSQLRDNGMCLYAKDENGRTANIIRLGFGTIKEGNVSKYVARVGLMLCQSQFFVDASDARVKYNEPDIKHKEAIHPESKQPYDFSDGCGMISISYAAKLTAKLVEANFLPENVSIPSAFQIQLGGCKGMLVVNPTLEKYDIVIRHSMQKFTSDDKMLGVLKVSDMRKVYLNQPLITVLNQLGIKKSVFLEMQLNVLQDILHCFLAEKNAANILKQYSVLHTHVDFYRLISTGINILNEPFFRLSLDNVIRHTTHLLKTKSRIMVPFEDGRTMFGVIDETKTLKYGQVFVQSTMNLEDRRETEIWKGKILVTKFPCMAAGDVRILEAIDVESLHHIRDCIVFPAFGNRPHPNEMARSDLDGDEYAVIRYKPLLNVDVKPPMVYPDNPPSGSSSNITTDKILALYTDSLENDSVGVIAKAHIAWADMLPAGILDVKCTRLALDYLRALNSPKTGEIVRLEKEQKPPFTPDFMEKFSHRPTYLSNRALGSLFRQICLFEIVFNEQNPLAVEGVDSELFSHPYSQNFTEEARKAYNDYKHLIINIQKMFKISTESEIITGVYNQVDEFMSGKEEMSGEREMVNIVLRNGVKRIRELFDFNCSDEEQRLGKASAYYQVTKEINSNTEIPYYGLPWLFSQYLSALAVRNRTARTRFETEETRLNHLSNLIDEKLIEKKKINEIDKPGVSTNKNRVKLAESILTDWLQRQSHLKLSLLNSRALTEQLIKDIIPEETKRYDSDPTVVPSVGMIVINTLKRLLWNELTPEFGASSEAKHLKYTVGFSSLMALYRLYRTHSVDHIIIPRKCGAMSSNLICLKTFRLKFNVNSLLYDFVKTKQDGFLKYIRGLTGVSKIKGDWLQDGDFSWSFQVIAFGTQTQMYALGYLLSKILFSKGPNVLSTIESEVCNGCNQSSH